MIHVLFVCVGNICRSPAAEAIMNQLIQEHDLSKRISCDSVGLTSTFLGKPADPTMQAYAELRNYELTSIARPITPEDIRHADYILVATENIRHQLSANLQNENDRKKIYNICEFCKYRPETEIPDPYYGGEEGFDLVLDILEDACTGLIEMLKKQIN